MGLQTLSGIYKSKGHEFIDDLFNSYVIVSEQIDGSRFLFQKQIDDSVIYYKGAGSEISSIERTLMCFYEKAISYIENLNNDIFDKIPDNWTFGFQYFPSLNPINISYDKLPKNNLILTDISIRNESGKIVKIINDPKVLNDWADILEVERPPFIHIGKLSDEQKNKIKNFLETNEQDLLALFKSQSFTRYIISVLNPNLKTTALSNSIDKDIEGIIFKFIKPGETEYYNAKLVDPVMHQLRHRNRTQRKPNDMYQIAMLDIVEFIEQQDLSKYMLTSESQEDRYIELMSLIFNDYVATNGHKYVGIDFETPEFATKPEFDVNLNYIKNSRTKEILSSEHMRNLYKIFISSFRKYRKHPTNILTDTVMNSINNIIDDIQSKVREISEEGNALDFSSFIKTQKYQNEKSIFENEIFEGLTLDYTEPGNKKVNIIVGRFQPFTLGHVKVFEQIHKQNKYPVIVFLVRGAKPNPEKNPINVDLQMRMFAAMQRQYKFLESIEVVNMAAIDKIFNQLRPAYEPVLWGAGTDRLKAYDNQIQRYKEELNSLPEFQMYEIKRGDDDISATKVRDAIKIDDFKTFSKMTPKSMHKFYEELKLELGVAEVANEDINEEDLNDDNLYTEEDLNESKSKNNESLQGEVDSPGSLHGNMSLIDELIKNNKIEDYKEFAKHYPNGIPSTFIINYFKTLNPKESKELANLLYSSSSIKDLNPKMYSNRSSVLGKLFDQKPTGLGKGEALIAWVIKGSRIQGGTEAFDVKIKNNKFEVKDYTSSNASIRVGVKGKVSNFEFWREISDTLSRLDKLTGYSTTPKFNISLYFSPEFSTVVNKILERKGNILSGECYKTDLDNIREFYELANKVENNQRGYTNIILRGPNIKPIELSIEMLNPSDLENDSINIIKANEDQTATYILSELRRLKYVRNPKDLDKDMQTATNRIIDGLTYIVFRKDSINITTDFVPDKISMSTLYIIERTLT
jgi:cytidyltransferase-like protein